MKRRVIIVLLLSAICAAQQSKPRPNGKITAQPTSEAVTKASQALQVGDLKAAETWARKAVQQKPQDAAGHDLMGVVLDQRGKRVEAEQQYREALRL